MSDDEEILRVVEWSLLSGGEDLRRASRERAATRASEAVVLTREGAERVKTSLRAAARIIEFYQTTLDQLGVKASLSAEWPGGEEASVKDLVLESIAAAVEIIDEGEE